MPRSIWNGSISFGLVNVPVAALQRGRAEGRALPRVPSRDRARGSSTSACPSGPARRSTTATSRRATRRPRASTSCVTPGRARVRRARAGRGRSTSRTSSSSPRSIRSTSTSRTTSRRSEGAEKSYALLREAMEKSERVAIGRFVMRTKQYLAAIRVADNVLVLETLYFADEIRDASELNIPTRTKVGRPRAAHRGAAHRQPDRRVEPEALRGHVPRARARPRPPQGQGAGDRRRATAAGGAAQGRRPGRGAAAQPRRAGRSARARAAEGDEAPAEAPERPRRRPGRTRAGQLIAAGIEPVLKSPRWRRRFPFPIPFGWFQVAFPEDLAPGDVTAAAATGPASSCCGATRPASSTSRTRTARTSARTSAYGGTVDGQRARVPVPRLEVRRRRRVHEHPVQPAHATRRRSCARTRRSCATASCSRGTTRTTNAPKWEIPVIDEIGDPGWTDFYSSSYVIHTVPQEMSENGADPAHFQFVHGTDDGRRDGVATTPTVRAR